MKNTIEFIKQIGLKSVITRLLVGAVIGLGIISLLIFSVNEPNPAWGSYWQVKPLIITPIVSGIGFLSFFLKEYLNPKSDTGKIVVFLLSTISFIVSLWIGTVLGLNGTMWN